MNIKFVENFIFKNKKWFVKVLIIMGTTTNFYIKFSPCKNFAFDI